jgi:hypothetical protein
VAELLPMFITVDGDKFTIQRTIKLGTETHTLVPYFYDAKTGGFKAKQWKSTAFPTIDLE